MRAEAIKLPTLRLNQRHLCDIELIMNGSFSPLDGFMTKQDYDSVVNNMRLENGALFPLPVTLDVSEKQVNFFKKITKFIVFVFLSTHTIQPITFDSLHHLIIPFGLSNSNLIFSSIAFTFVFSKKKLLNF